MTPDQYWYEDPRLLDNYEQSYIAKSKIGLQDKWIQGIYFRAALQSSMIISVPAFDTNKISRNMPKYPDNPAKYEDNGELTEAEKERQREQLYQMFKNMKVRG